MNGMELMRMAMVAGLVPSMMKCLDPSRGVGFPGGSNQVCWWTTQGHRVTLVGHLEDRPTVTITFGGKPDPDAPPAPEKEPVDNPGE